ATVARSGRAEALAAAMREANDAVLAATGTADQHGAASTLVAAAIGANDAAVGNLGDSRAYLVRDRAVRRLTADHSGDAPNSITRFVGDPRGVQPDVFVEELLPGDRLVLCSDGLTRYVSDEEIAAQVSEASLDRAAGTLVDLANARGGEDNVTVVLYAAAPRGMVVASVGGALVNAALALLVAIVIARARAAGLPEKGQSRREREEVEGQRREEVIEEEHAGDRDPGDVLDERGEQDEAESDRPGAHRRDGAPAERDEASPEQDDVAGVVDV